MIEIDRTGPVPIIQLDLGPFTVSETMLDAIGIDLLELVGEIQPPLVIVDLSPTHHLGSKAIGVLLNASRAIRRRKGRIAYCQLNPYSREVLRALRLDQHWEIYGSRDDAIDAMGAGH